jgi:hypothetical protein
MCRTFPTCESIDTVLKRVAVEIRSAADDLSAIEADVAEAVSCAPARPERFERLQSLDRLVQQLRALDVFLATAAPCECGRIDIETALDRVWLETMRKRLGGGRPTTTPLLAATEPDFW